MEQPSVPLLMAFEPLPKPWPPHNLFSSGLRQMGDLGPAARGGLGSGCRQGPGSAAHRGTRVAGDGARRAGVGLRRPYKFPGNN